MPGHQVSRVQVAVAKLCFTKPPMAASRAQGEKIWRIILERDDLLECSSTLTGANAIGIGLPGFCSWEDHVK